MVLLNKDRFYSLRINSTDDSTGGFFAVFSRMNSEMENTHRVIWDNEHRDNIINSGAVGVNGESIDNDRIFEFWRYIFLKNNGKIISNVDIVNKNNEFFSLECVYLSNDIDGVYIKDPKSDYLKKILSVDEYQLEVE